MTLKDRINEIGQSIISGIKNIGSQPKHILQLTSNAQRTKETFEKKFEDTLAKQRTLTRAGLGDWYKNNIREPLTDSKYYGFQSPQIKLPESVNQEINSHLTAIRKNNIDPLLSLANQKVVSPFKKELAREYDDYVKTVYSPEFQQQNLDLALGMATPVNSVEAPLTKDIVEELIEKGAKKASPYVTPFVVGAKNKLRFLLGKYDDVLRSMGHNPKTISPGQAYEVLGLAEKGKGEVVSNFDDAFARWIGRREASKTIGVQKAIENKIPQELSTEVINFMEGAKSKNPQVIEFAGKLRTDFDNLYLEAKNSGLDVGYLKDYITHIWQQKPQEVEELYQAAKKTFKFAKDRKIPTYEEGIQMGLTPLYKNPGAILGNYVESLYKTKANISFINELKQSGIIVDAKQGMRLGYEPLTGPGFPQSVKKIANQTVVSPYYAPQEIAQIINRVFSGPGQSKTETGLRYGAKMMAGIQDIVLSGGVPKTPLNAWTMNQYLFKEVPAGRVTGGLKAFYHSMVDADQYFAQNAGVIKEMQLNNIPVHPSLDLAAIDATGLEKFWGKSLGEAWGKFVNEPTFKKFSPMLQIEFYKDTYRVAFKNTQDAAKARQIATQATKNFYGIISSDTLIKQSEIGQNLKTIALMAPRYRETILNFLWNTAKGLRHSLAPENINNTRWLVGAIMTYGVYDYFNFKFNGNHLHENPPGLEDKLLIPAGDTTIGIPFMSSILTVPRAIYRGGRRLVGGDVPGTIGELGSSGLSVGLAPFFDIARNQDYFGREIVKESDSPGDKLKATVGYIANRWNHPYLRELFDPRSKNDPAYQRISRAMEAPIRYYDTSSLDARFYYAEKDKVLKGLNPSERAVYDKLHKAKATDEDGLPVTGYDTRGQMANALDRLSNPDIVAAETTIALETAKKTGEPVNPFYTLSPKQQETILILKTFYPGDKTKSQIIQANEEWIQDYYRKRDLWTEYMKASGKFTDTLAANGKPVIDANLRKKLDEYFALPSGTGARTAYRMKNPEVGEYFEKNRDFTNAQRADLGLPLLPSFDSNGYGNYVRKAKKDFGSLPDIKSTNIKIPKFSGSLKVKPLKTPILTVGQPRFSTKGVDLDPYLNQKVEMPNIPMPTQGTKSPIKRF